MCFTLHFAIVFKIEKAIIIRRALPKKSHESMYKTKKKLAMMLRATTFAIAKFEEKSLRPLYYGYCVLLRLGKNTTEKQRFHVQFINWPYLDCFEQDHPTLVKEVKVEESNSKVKLGDQLT